MLPTVKDVDADLIYHLQNGLPIVRRPFAEVGAQIGLPEEKVLERVRGYFDDGTARRIGAIFDLRRLGYTSVLCAVAVEPGEIDEVAGRITPHDGVTHCYLRTPAEDLDPAPQKVNGLTAPNLWFTLSVPGEEFGAELAAMERRVRPRKLLVLPATRRFKINVIFDLRREQEQQEEVPGLRSDAPGRATWDGAARQFTDREKALIRALQGNMSLCPEPFSAAAESAGWCPGHALERLREWDESGIIRRVAMICRHRRMGFKANGMCTWRVPDDEIIERGRALATHSAVTHCYKRAPAPEFPYNLYAMIHTGAYADTRALFNDLSEEFGLEGGLVFLSTREHKKTSPTPFSER